MTNIEKIKKFIDSNDEQTIRDYHDRLHQNLKELNAKEEKFILWEFILLFLYIFANNITFSDLSLGPISITDTTVLIKILPMIFIYVIYTIHSVVLQKQEMTTIFEAISEKRFNDILNEDNSHSFLSRIYKPYEFTNSITSMYRNNLNTINIVLGLTIILPLIFIAFVPYYIAVSMLIDLYNNHMADGLGKLSFFVTLWILIIIIFDIISGLFGNNEKDVTPV